MLPFLEINNVFNCCGADLIFSGKNHNCFCSGGVGGSYLSNFIVCQTGATILHPFERLLWMLSHPVSIASCCSFWMKSKTVSISASQSFWVHPRETFVSDIFPEHMIRMKRIFGWGYIFEIINIIIGFIPINMINMISYWTFSNKSKHYKSMNRHLGKISIFMKMNAWISYSWSYATHHLGSLSWLLVVINKTSYHPLIRNIIKSFVFRDRSPFLNFLLKIEDQLCNVVISHDVNLLDRFADWLERLGSAIPWRSFYYPYLTKNVNRLICCAMGQRDDYFNP